jgi:glyoxylate reductase
VTADVVVTHRLPAGVGAEIPETWRVWPGEGAMPRDQLLEAVAGADGLLSMLVDEVDAELVARAGRLRVISQMAVGVDNIDLAAATEAGIPVGHTPGVLTETTADTAFALLAASVRRLPEGQADLREGGVGEWDPDYLLGGDLWDTTLGVVGLGRIGSAVARRATGFGMRLLYTGRSPKSDDLGADFVGLEELLGVSDHVVLAAPLTSETRHMIDSRTLPLMRDGATLVNIARGGLIDHDALVREASTDRIRAALDVTDPEPLPAGHPLLHLPNVLVVPHLGSASVRTRAAMARLAVANLQAGLAGERLAECANPEVYRGSA